jgi:hypothetical protein
MKQELTKVKTQAVANIPAHLMDMSQYGEADKTDILIPKLLLQQGLSKLVAAEKAKMGDICDSITGETLGDKSKPLEIIPLKLFKTWVLFKTVAGKQEYFKTEPFVAGKYDSENAIVDGVPGAAYQSLNFYVLLKKDLTEPFALPYAISFKSTGYTAGKKLNTQFEISKAAGMPPFTMSYKLVPTKITNDKGVFYNYDIEKGEAVKEFTLIEKLVKMLSTSNVVVDDSDEKDLKVKPQAQAADEY